MAYNKKSYRGTLRPIRTPDKSKIPASPVSIDSLVQIVDDQLTAADESEVGFSKSFKYCDRLVTIELNSDKSKAVVQNVSAKRGIRWPGGLGPGYYAINRSIAIEDVFSPLMGTVEREAQMRTNISSILRFGFPLHLDQFTPASEEDVVAAIDTVFMAQAGVTTEHRLTDSPILPSPLL
ncbi:MAG TPA: hypothetical protein VLF79_03495 [Candidatus Saccharimonadales bacterium]|nr:hypothetical protein [Candidatus Saccharimonadales bacterium]